MKQTHDSTSNNEIDRLIELFSSQDLVRNKTRINLYIPKVVVKLIDHMSADKSRGELITNLVLKEAKHKRRKPYGLFSSMSVSEQDIDEVISTWEKAIDEAG